MFSTIVSFLIYGCQKVYMFFSQRLILTTKNVTYVLKFSTWQLLTRSSMICNLKSLVQEHGLCHFEKNVLNDDECVLNQDKCLVIWLTPYN
jgi:hypothetical protein